MKYIFLVSILFLFSCCDTKKKNAGAIVEEWINKEIVLPETLVFTIQGKDTIQFPKTNGFKIVNYVDSTGCTVCKMKLAYWTGFIKEVDSVSNDSVQFLFFFFPKNERDLRYALKVDQFKYPVCIDLLDSINKMNNFPTDVRFQTFLLDKNNKVIAIGNPIYAKKVRDLYLNFISGKKEPSPQKQVQTEITVSETLFDFGKFSFKESQKCIFTLQNTGKALLVIDDVNTSCGCTSVQYSKEPVKPGESLRITVIYKADHPEHFRKTITIYCNVPTSPLQLKITGNAE